ncbi:MAG TPA: transposase [Dehalococcoidia bacterium]|nr:transposase [Dehalococcoidia bacterium]
MSPNFRRKRNRLPAQIYKQRAAYSITTTVEGRRPLFHNPQTVELCLEKLREASQKRHFQVVAYCFMPDHLHLLLVAASGTDLVAFMRFFKQQSGYKYRQFSGDLIPLWQKSYYDHVLRKEEDLLTVARYIWGNPLRAGIVSDIQEYPFSGSFLIDDWKSAV